MLHRKPPKPDKSDEQRALEERVDAMMDVEHGRDNDATTPEPPKKDVPTESAEESASADPATAPALPVKLKKKAGITDAEPKQPTKAPLVIKLTDTPKSATATGETSATEQADQPVPAANPVQGDTLLDDKATDEAVDDIVAQEGDTILALEDAVRARKTAAANKQGDSPKVFSTLLWFVVFLLAAGIVYISYRYLGL